VKNFTFALALTLGAMGAASAAPLEVIQLAAAPSTFQVLPARLSAAELMPVQAHAIVAPPGRMSELPEPEVFLMMLVGLCLIGYRASKVSDEKFE
jgi:hypothetical protein